MGDYSVVCAVTGLPITGSQKVVGFEVEPFCYDPTKSRYVPKSFPVEGEYDMAGGIKGFDFSSNVAIIHKEVWENAESYWHYMNRKTGQNFFNAEEKLKKAKEGFESEYSRDTWTLNDYVYYEIYKNENNSDESMVLRELLSAKNGNVTNLSEKELFIHRSAFGQLLTEKIINGWSDKDSIALYRLVCFYSGQSITGRQISPSNQPYIEQYPDNYKQRIKLLRFTTGLAVRLQKDLTPTE